MPAKITASDGEIGRRIANLRKRKGIRQKELAQMIGVRPTCICRYELGREFVSLARRAQIAEALGLDAAVFADPDLIEVTHDERDLIESYRRIRAAGGRSHVIRVMAAIEHGREISAC